MTAAKTQGSETCVVGGSKLSELYGPVTVKGTNTGRKTDLDIAKLK